MKTILVISIVWLIQIIGMVAYFKFGWFKFFYHDVMGWHVPSDNQNFDGCSFTSTCKYCGEKIMQDSQGNWF